MNDGFLEAVQEMRRLQKRWFHGDKSRETLIACKVAEKAVDDLLAQSAAKTPPEVWGIVEEVRRRGGRIYLNDAGKLMVNPGSVITEELRDRMRMHRQGLEIWVGKGIQQIVMEVFGDKLVAE